MPPELISADAADAPNPEKGIIPTPNFPHPDQGDKEDKLLGI